MYNKNIIILNSDTYLYYLPYRIHHVISELMDASYNEKFLLTSIHDITLALLGIHFSLASPDLVLVLSRIVLCIGGPDHCITVISTDRKDCNNAFYPHLITHLTSSAT